MCGVSSLGLSTKVLPAARQGATFQDDLEQRVVPRRDQAADADRLVHDPADHVGVAGVDDPAGVLGGDPAVVAEDRDDVGDVVLALDQPLAGVERLQPGDGVGVALEQVGDAEQQVAALAGGRARPGPVVEGARAPRRSPRRCPRGRPRRPRPPASRRPGSGSRGARPRARSSTRRRRRDPAATATHSPQRPVSCVCRNRLLSRNRSLAEDAAAHPPSRVRAV